MLCYESKFSLLHPAAPRKDRERVLARQEFIEELSLWNDTDRQIYHTRVPLPSEWTHSIPSVTI